MQDAVVRLTFPDDRIVGTVGWAGAWQPDRGPVLATGAVTVPEGARIDLHVDAIESSTPDDREGWTLETSMQPVNLDFLRHLPRDAIEACTCAEWFRSRLTRWLTSQPACAICT